MKTSVTKRPVVWGALLLTAAGVITRLLGLGFRVLLARLTGAEVIGLFQMAMPVYRMAWTTASLGLPVALARVTAARFSRGDVAGAAAATRLATLLLVGASLVTGLLLLVGAPSLAVYVVGDERTRLTIATLALVMLPSTLSGVLRAYSQGQQDMLPTAVAQVVEQVVRVPAVLVVVGLMLPMGAPHASLGIVLGSAIGEIAGLLTLLALTKWRSPTFRAQRASTHGRHPRNQWRRKAATQATPSLKEIMGPAFPILIGQWVGAIVQMSHMSLILRRLAAAGLDAKSAAVQFGHFSGMAVPVLFMPMVAVFPVVRVLIPAVSNLYERGDGERLRRLFLKSLLTSLAVGMTTAVVMIGFADGIASALYNDPRPAHLIRILGFSAPFVYIHQISNAALNGLGKTAIALRNLIIATIVRLGMIYYMTVLPAYGIDAAAWALVADSVLSAWLNTQDAWFTMRMGHQAYGHRR